MIRDAHQIGDNRPAFQAPFQEQILAHWHQIQKNRRFPDKRDFRPQMFPKFLPQLAIVTVMEGNQYQERLTGELVLEVLRLRGTEDRLVAPRDQKLRRTVTEMLGVASKSAGPVYFEGLFMPEQASPIDFTTLVLPFSHNGADDVLDTLLLAFDFGRLPDISAFSRAPEAANI